MILFEYFVENPLQVHIAISVIAATVWVFRHVRFGAISVIADLLSILSIPFAYEFYQHFTSQVPAGSEGSRETTFFFLSLGTFGLVLLVTVLGSWFFGRGIGRVVRAIYKKIF